MRAREECEKPESIRAKLSLWFLLLLLLFPSYALGAGAVGDGTLGPSTQYPVAGGVEHPALGDFNSDGKIDVAVSLYWEHKVAILLGNGDGSFGAPLSLSLGAGTNPQQLVARDFDGDGMLDLAVAAAGVDRVLILKGAGNGSFSQVDSTFVGANAYPQAIRSADLNADGKLDLVTSNLNNATVSVLYGAGNGTFSLYKNLSLPGGARATDLDLSDVDADGDLDIVTANSGINTLKIFTNAGNGSFSIFGQIGLGVGVEPRGLVISDFNGDNKPDIAVAEHGRDAVEVLLGNGDATFSTKLSYNLPNGSAPLFVRTGDINGDGVDDLVTSNEGMQKISVLMGNGDGSFRASNEYATAANGPISITTGNLDGNGASDVVATDGASWSISVFLAHVFQCADGVDNDSDGLVDMLDPGCVSPKDDEEGDGTSECQDGIDNDSDGARDYPSDFSCSSPQDDDETNPRAQCQDGADNDNDGLIDMADPGCSSPQDNEESDGTTQCQDEADNDGDGLIDMTDPGCSSPQDNDESDGTTQCQDSIDNDSDGAIDYPSDFGCSNPQDNNESNPKAKCQDRADNDGDGLIDMADPGCSSPQDNSEKNSSGPQCDNGIDDDGDGRIDYRVDGLGDPDCTSPSDPNENPELPPLAPQNLSASDGEFKDFVRVIWDAVDGANGYQIYRSEVPGERGDNLGAVTTELSLDDYSAPPGMVFYYSATALNEHGESVQSNIDAGFRRESVRLLSPVFTKFNTFLNQLNYLELISAGSKGLTVDVTLYNLRGEVLIKTAVALDAYSQQDVLVSGLVQQACPVASSRSVCRDFVDLDGNGIVDTYGMVRLDFDDEDTEKALLGRMSNYRTNPDGESFSFAFAKELVNPSYGTSYATANTFDPQGMVYQVPNWAEVINLDTEKSHAFRYKLYNQNGKLVSTASFVLPPLGERDVQAGHEIRDIAGHQIEGVYLAEVDPEDNYAPYFLSVSRYSSNAPGGVEPNTYNFAFAIHGSTGATEAQLAPITNELRKAECATVTNWLEVVNVRARAVSGTVRFRNSAGRVVGSESYSFGPKSQYHFNASVLLAKGEVGLAEVRSEEPGALISQSLVYYHDCERNEVQTAYMTAGRVRARSLQAGTINTYLGMENVLQTFGTTDADFTADVEMTPFGGETTEGELGFSGYGTNEVKVSNGGFVFPTDSYGAIVIQTPEEQQILGQVLRVRKKTEGGRRRLDFVMPTPLR